MIKWLKKFPWLRRRSTRFGAVYAAPPIDHVPSSMLHPGSTNRSFTEDDPSDHTPQTGTVYDSPGLIYDQDRTLQLDDFIDQQEVSSAIIGRSENCDVRLSHQYVARLHCEIQRTGDTYRIRNLGSKNGTFLNGVRISQEWHALVPGDRLRIAAYDCIFEGWQGDHPRLTVK